MNAGIAAIPASRALPQLSTTGNAGRLIFRVRDGSGSFPARYGRYARLFHFSFPYLKDFPSVPSSYLPLLRLLCTCQPRTPSTLSPLILSSNAPQRSKCGQRTFSLCPQDQDSPLDDIARNKFRDIRSRSPQLSRHLR